MVSLDAAGRFSAVGFFDGRRLTGLTRTSFRVEAPDGMARMGILRARYRGGQEIEIEFAENLNGATQRREVWTLHRKFGARPGDAPPEAPGDSLPALGEYVYVEELPVAIEKVPPDYPERARFKNVEGTVLVQALIGKDGRVRDTKVVRSIPELDDAAVAAVKRWRFKPARSKEGPVAVWVAIPVRFRLN